MSSSVDLDALAKTCGEWLRGTGPESDIVVSSRIRLARNLARFPFLSRADDSTRAEVERTVRGQLEDLDIRRRLNYIPVDSLDKLDRQLLVERQLISREHADGHGARGVAISKAETVSVMLNEEDHLRMQVLRSGFDLEDAWREITDIDDAIESELTYAFHEQFGYLTACPTNVGTGIRVSVMLHLPALVLTKEVQRVFQALTKVSLTVRGLYGEGSQAMGDFYQISNQMTLGKSEQQMIETLHDVVPSILKYERAARETLISKDRQSIDDKISRNVGTLRSARSMSSEETMHLLSSVRLGLDLGLIDDLELSEVNQLFIQTQPAHLQKIVGERLETAERNVARAGLLRRRLAGDA